MQVKSLINITYKGKIYQEGLVYSISKEDKEKMEKDIISNSMYINDVFKEIEIKSVIKENLTTEKKDEREELREKYKEKFGKEAHPNISLEKLKNRLGV